MWSAREPEARNTIENDEEMTKTIENDEKMMKNEQPAVAPHGQVFADSCLLQVGLGELLAPGGVMIGPFGDALLMVERSPFSHVSLLRGGEVSSLMSGGDILPLAGVVPTLGSLYTPSYPLRSGGHACCSEKSSVCPSSWAHL